MKVLKLLAMSAMMIGMTACVNDDDNKIEVSCSWPDGNMIGNVTYVTDPDGVSHVYEASYITYNFRIDDGTVEIVVNSLPLTDKRKVNFRLPEMKYTTTQYGAYQATLPHGMTGNNLELASFNSGVAIRYVNGSSIMLNAYYADMLIDDYQVSVIQTANSYYGTSTVKTLVGQAPDFTKNTMSYDMKLDVKTMTADITIYNAQFASNMPEQTKIVIPGVPVTLSHKGIEFAGSDITPLMANGAPKPEYLITDLTGLAGQGTGLQLQCTVAGVFQLNAQCGYYSQSF